MKIDQTLTCYTESSSDYLSFSYFGKLYSCMKESRGIISDNGFPLSQRVFSSTDLKHLVARGLLNSSEAICETDGSMMERYHTRRHTNTGPLNENSTLQKE